ncbi:MAG: aspartate/glutamate racemase family protein, partial [Sulfitobacter sp.]
FHMTGGSAPVGILTADKEALSVAHLEVVGAGSIPVVIQGLEETSEFAEVILRNERTSMDLDLIEDEVLDAAKKLKGNAPDIRSLVLECTDLPPYAERLQKELALPIFDLTTLATMVHEVVVRKSFQGLMPL